MSRGRRALSVHEKQQRERFIEKIRSYSTEAVENIRKISVSSLDSRARLQASIWLAEKAVGKDFTAFEPGTEEDRTMKVNLIVHRQEYKPTEQDEQDIREVKNGLYTEEQDEEEWDVNEEEEDWGSEIYDP